MLVSSKYMYSDQHWWSDSNITILLFITNTQLHKQYNKCKTPDFHNVLHNDIIYWPHTK